MARSRLETTMLAVADALLATAVQTCRRYGIIVVEAQEEQEDPRAGEVRSYMDYLQANDVFIGSAAISVQGRLLVHHQTGPAFPSSAPPPPNSGTRYRIGSVSKIYTATMILQLVEEGKLSLDQVLADFYPTIRKADKITIEHMLRHQSGIYDFLECCGYWGYHDEPQTKSFMLKKFEGLKSKFEPGSQTEYSNTNYFLLAFILQDVTGRTLGQELQSRIVRPLNLTKTSTMVSPNRRDNVATSFEWKGKKEQWEEFSPFTHSSVAMGSGFVMSTMDDQVVFIERLLGEENSDDSSIRGPPPLLLQEDSVARMKDIQNGYGMGMILYLFGGVDSYGHAGSINKFNGMTVYQPETKIAIAVSSNGISIDRECVGMVTHVLANITLNLTYDREQIYDCSSTSRPVIAGWTMLVAVALSVGLLYF